MDGFPTCSYCGITYDPMLSEAQFRYSFCTPEHERLSRPGLLREAGSSMYRTCPSGLCSLDEPDPDEGIEVTR